MKNILKIKGIIVLGLLLFVGSCTKDFEEMNVNPNVPVVVPATNILASSIRLMGDNYYDVWVTLNNFSSYAGHATKIQYIDEARYSERQSIVNGRWTAWYNIQLDIKKLKGIAREEGNTNMEAVAMTLEAYMWQIMTDTWGAIPFTNALQAEDGVTNPSYDTQQDIYYALLDSLEVAADLYNEPNQDPIGDGDFIYGGDVDAWQKFCNSIRLRIAIRMSDVAQADAFAVINSILTNAADYPVISGNGDNAQLQWPGVAPYKEPWAEDYTGGRDDHGMCEILVNKLKDLNDPRLDVMSIRNKNGEHLGVDPGSADGDFEVNEISRINEYYRGENVTGWSFLFRYPEVCFIKAEYYARTGNATAAITAYEAGVEASMIEHSTAGNAGAFGVDISAAAIDGYLAQAAVAFNGTTADLDKVFIQKWISLFKQAHEAWAETRRTDVPEIPTAQGSPFGTSHNRQPFRWWYPSDEETLNASNIQPHLSGIVDGFWGTKMWWDTRGSEAY